MIIPSALQFTAERLMKSQVELELQIMISMQ